MAFDMLSLSKKSIALHSKNIRKREIEKKRFENFHDYAFGVVLLFGNANFFRANCFCRRGNCFCEIFACSAKL